MVDFTTRRLDVGSKGGRSAGFVRRHVSLWMSLETPVLKTEPARILIVDDHPLVRDGLALLLGSELDLQICSSRTPKFPR